MELDNYHDMINAYNLRMAQKRKQKKVQVAQPRDYSTAPVSQVEYQHKFRRPLLLAGGFCNLSLCLSKPHTIWGQ